MTTLTDKTPLARSRLIKAGLIQGLFMLLLLATTVVLDRRLVDVMDGYERGLLWLGMLSVMAWGWWWPTWRTLWLLVLALSVLASLSYQGDLQRAQSQFWLQYFLASQSLVMWMMVSFCLSLLAYLGLAVNSQWNWYGFARQAVWWGVGLGLAALAVRWRESYLLGSAVGHIPVSNLYEVFVLFCVITGAVFLYYEKHSQFPLLGAFVLPVIVAACGFIVWYATTRGAHTIAPLIPALQSYWMKIHVPANFIGYGCFSFAAMVAIPYLMVVNGRAGSRLPSAKVLEDLMYRAISLGFVFFTIATILGALWAAEAWGSYWSWDPKETWALLVWLNYAAWLHLRMSQKLSPSLLGWWAIVGFFVTLFAFLGVNMFLSGLHSYGKL